MLHNKLTNGLTLVEMLVVIATIGVIAAAIGLPAYAAVQKARLNEAATLVNVEIKRARSRAQLTSVDQNITWSATTLSAGPGRVVTLPYGARIVSPPTTLFTYVAPYAEFQANDPSTNAGRLEIVDASGRWHTAVDLVGVTGKPYRRDTIAMSTPLP